MIAYLDFELSITRAGQGPDAGYRVQAVDSRGGQAEASFSLAESSAMLRERLRAVQQGDDHLAEARAVGEQLFEAVFAGDVLGGLRSSLIHAATGEKGLRLRLHLDPAAGELWDLPWETLYYAPMEHFFAISRTTPLTRYLSQPQSPAPLAVEPPLRVLAAVASPGDLDLLDVTREWSILEDALGHLDMAGYVTVDRLEPATLPALEERLKEDTYHIFHFIGSGRQNDSGTSELIFETEDDQPQPVTGNELAAVLRKHDTLRLAVMCTSVQRGPEKGEFPGLASSLVQAGIPAALVVNPSISNFAAIEFLGRFYTALASGFPVDAAVAEGRKAVYVLGGNVDWATPQLYVSVPDARLFDFDEEADERETGVPTRALDDDLTTTVGEVRISASGPREVDIDSVYGDLVEGDKIIHGDEVLGDKISIGSISGSSVAIGSGARSGPGGTVISPFTLVRRELDEMPISDADREDAEFAIRQLEKENKADEPDVDRIDRWLEVLEDIAPAAVEVLVKAVLDPASAISAGVRLAIMTWRKARKA
ncbi:MAG: CHAT domain-containing protein [Aggregatilineales bacterium]|nr:CHAT domain-containing protein [Aggregatilineales bacterium]HPV06587.1 CHAT domain-containing protein [Aggregatilineales bacterium]HQE19944.1 CHAT domain-containing protein [Aggregatilineales bacterium]